MTSVQPQRGWDHRLENHCCRAFHFLRRGDGHLNKPWQQPVPNEVVSAGVGLGPLTSAIRTGAREKSEVKTECLNGVIKRTVAIPRNVWRKSTTTDFKTSSFKKKFFVKSITNAD